MDINYQTNGSDHQNGSPVGGQSPQFGSNSQSVVANSQSILWAGGGGSGPGVGGGGPQQQMTGQSLVPAANRRPVSPPILYRVLSIIFSTSGRGLKCKDNSGKYVIRLYRRLEYFYVKHIFCLLLN